MLGAAPEFSHITYEHSILIQDTHTHTHTHNYKVLTHCFPNNLWCLCCGMELSVCVCMCVCGSQLVPARVLAPLCVCVCVCVCVLPAGGWPGPPRKDDVWRLFGVWTWQVSSLQPANILYGSSLQSYHILCGCNNKLSRAKGTACHCTCCQ